MLYYETSKSQQYVPRAVFVDFQPLFGSYLSTFSHAQVERPEAGEQWHADRCEVREQDMVAKSQF